MFHYIPIDMFYYVPKGNALTFLRILLLSENSFTSLYNNPVRITQEIHYVSGTEPSRLMLFGEAVAVYC
jgi:hypothetical protein